MKRFIVMFLLCAFMLTLCACDVNNIGNDPSDTASPGNTNDDTNNQFEQDHIDFPCSKEGVDAFYERLVAGNFTSIQDESCYFNVTPNEVAGQTDYKIFKESKFSKSYVMMDNEIYELCESFGGHGFVNAVVCDFDSDGNKDLLVASSWGSGMHRAEISIFNSATKKSTVIYTHLADLVVRIAPSEASSENNSDVPTYQVCRVDMQVSNGIDISCEVIEVIGHVIKNGDVVFVPVD